MTSRYDLDLPQNEAQNSNIKTILIVQNIHYNFKDNKTGQGVDRSVFIIGNSEKDCTNTIGANLPPKTKWSIDSYETRVCEVNAITPVIKRLLYDELKGEFESKETLGDKMKRAAKGK